MEGQSLVKRCDGLQPKWPHAVVCACAVPAQHKRHKGTHTHTFFLFKCKGTRPTQDTSHQPTCGSARTNQRNHRTAHALGCSKTMNYTPTCREICKRDAPPHYNQRATLQMSSSKTGGKAISWSRHGPSSLPRLGPSTGLDAMSTRSYHVHMPDCATC